MFPLWWFRDCCTRENFPTPPWFHLKEKRVNLLCESMVMTRKTNKNRGQLERGAERLDRTFSPSCRGRRVRPRCGHSHRLHLLGGGGDTTTAQTFGPNGPIGLSSEAAKTKAPNTWSRDSALATEEMPLCRTTYSICSRDPMHRAGSKDHPAPKLKPGEVHLRPENATRRGPTQPNK